MEYDYTGICDCYYEVTGYSLREVKEDAMKHLRTFCSKKDENPRIFINRNFRGSDIDDSFKDVIITRTQAVNDLNKAILDSFFGKALA